MMQPIQQESIEDCILSSLQTSNLTLKELSERCKTSSLVVSNILRKLVANNKVGFDAIVQTRRKNLYYLVDHKQNDEIVQQQKDMKEDHDAWWSYISERYKSTRNKFPKHEIEDGDINGLI